MPKPQAGVDDRRLDEIDGSTGCPARSLGGPQAVDAYGPGAPDTDRCPDAAGSVHRQDAAPALEDAEQRAPSAVGARRVAVHLHGDDMFGARVDRIGELEGVADEGAVGESQEGQVA